MLLTLAWGALGIATVWTGTFVLNRRDGAARLAALQTRWATAVDRKRDTTAIAAYYRASATAKPADRWTIGRGTT